VSVQAGLSTKHCSELVDNALLPWQAQEAGATSGGCGNPMAS